MSTDSYELDVLKGTVQAAGARWVGIQQPLLDNEPELVLFQSDITHSTLALPVNEVDIDAVRRKVQESDRIFSNSRIGVPRATLLRIMQNLRVAAEEIESYLERKK